PGVELPSAAVSLPEACVVPLRRAGIVGRVEDGRVLLDLRTVPAELDPGDLAARVRGALGER
ncbi:L-seryl-tRNA(Sec) selenium transferase, partial [Actinoallomurus acaciae]